MEVKVLFADPEKCGGCRTCELICSWSHARGLVRPSVSRIRVLKREELGVTIPFFCQQCSKPVCQDACPVDAISRSMETGALVIDAAVCIGCKACFTACPYGAIGFDPESKTPVKCDLCGGEPQCVKWCPREAIKYERAEIAASFKQRTMMEEHLARALVEARRGLMSTR